MIRRLLSSSFARNVATLVGGTATAQVVAVAFYPLLARLYQPDDLGALAVFTSILSILLTVCTLRYHVAIPLADDDDAAANLLGASLLATLATALLSSLAITILTETIAAVTNTPALTRYLWLLPLVLVISGAYQTLSFWALRQRWFTALARTKISQSLGSVATQIAGGLLFAGSPAGLFLGQVVGQSIGTPVLARQAWRSNEHSLRRVSLRGMLAVSRRFQRFALYSTPAALLYTLSTMLPAILLAAAYGPSVTGFYAVGVRVVRTPLDLLAGAVGQVFYSDGSRLFREDPERFYRMYLRMSLIMLVVGMVPAALLAWLGPVAFALVFGEAWAMSGTYVQILSVMYLTLFVMNPVMHTLNIMERQGVQILINGLRLLVVVASITIPAALGLPGEFAIAVYSLGVASTYAGSWLVVTGILRRYLKGRSPA